MRTYAEILTYKPHSFDGRDIVRLIIFVKDEDLKNFGENFTPESCKISDRWLNMFGLKPNEDGSRTVVPFTRENVLTHLKSDLEFAFEKALDKRGLSANFMYYVIRMWNWILDEGLDDWDDDKGYAQYGLPLLKATAVKYGFDNPIGDDAGNEFKYSEEGDLC